VSKSGGYMSGAEKVLEIIMLTCIAVELLSLMLAAWFVKVKKKPRRRRA